MATMWSPPNIGPICVQEHAQLTSCSQTGYMFLALVAQLFGSSIDNQVSYRNPFQLGSEYSSDSGFGSLTSPPIETSILGPTKAPLGPNPIRTTPGIETATPVLGPVIPTSFNQHEGIRSHGPKGSHGYSETSFKFKPNSDFDFENPFSNSPPVFDFNYENQKGYFDFDTADSKKVTVRADKSKNGKSRRKRQVREQFDFIIVGAGSAGCVLANRLSEVKKWKILLLEAGPEEPDIASVPAFAPTLGGSSIDWNYRTQPEELTCRAQMGQTCAWFRGRTMGGSSAINYMVYIRGNKRDYDQWAELGNHGWSYHEVLPYFKKAENNRDLEARDKYHHSVGGPLNVERFSYVDINTMMLVQAFKEKGLPITDFNAENQIGTDIAQSTSKDGRRWSANTAYIRPIRHQRPNLKIITGALVTKVLIDPVTKTAVGVEYIQNGGYNAAYGTKEVILSSGPINSPKILMVSGVGPKEQLANLNIPVVADLKVGYNLQDHVTTDALILSLSNKTSTLLNGQQLLNEVYDYYLQHPKKHGPLATTATLNGIAFINTEFPFTGVPDIQYHFDGRNVREFYSDPTSYSATNIFPLSFYDGIAARPLLLTPKSRGYVLLNQTDPVFGPPLIYPRFFTVKTDLDTLIAGMKFVVSLEKTEAFQRSGARFIKEPVQACVGYPWGTYDYFECILMEYTSTIYHPVGTCKMGPKWDRDAVVDPRLRVYAIKKLRVVDSSIMPLIIRGNTNAPTMMIAEKASDMIKEEWFL